MKQATVETPLENRSGDVWECCPNGERILLGRIDPSPSGAMWLARIGDRTLARATWEEAADVVARRAVVGW